MVSPLGAALMGRTVGDEVTFSSPGGARSATITSVR
jgi:transcription elongation GreA/GreB family factor